MTGTRAVVVLAALLLTGCGAGATSSGSASTPPAPDPSSLSGRDIGLQLRPVLATQPAAAGACPSPSTGASRTARIAPATNPVTACSTDGKVVYTLAAAVVDGTHWESLRVVDRDGAAEIDGLIDPVGSSALTEATADLSTNDEPQDQLAVYAEGQVLAAPTVVQPIYGGVLVISGDYTRAQAQELVDRLTG